MRSETAAHDRDNEGCWNKSAPIPDSYDTSWEEESAKKISSVKDKISKIGLTGN
jgi:hypothetical protein